MPAPDYPPPKGLPTDTGRRVAQKLIELPEQSWVGPFAMRWTKFDVIARIAVILTITLIPIYTTWGLDKELQATEKRLEEHSTRALQISTKAVTLTPAEIARCYADLNELAENYRGKAYMLGRIQTATLFLPGFLLVLMGIGEYWRFKSVIQLRKAMAFLKSPEGISRLQDQ